MNYLQSLNEVLDSISEFYARTKISDPVKLYNTWRRINYSNVTDNKERAIIIDFCHSIVNMDSDLIQTSI